MGNTTGYFIPRPTYCMIDECLCSFSCYRDDQLNSPSGGACELPLAVEEAAGVYANAWSIYPVPFRDHLTVRSNRLRQEAALFLLDITGRALQEAAFNGGSAEIEVPGLATGTYILRIVDQQGRTSHRKVVKE